MSVTRCSLRTYKRYWSAIKWRSIQESLLEKHKRIQTHKQICTEKWFIINPFTSDIGMQAKQVSTKEIFWTVWPIHTWQSTNFEMFCFHFQTWGMLVIKFSETIAENNLYRNKFNMWTVPIEYQSHHSYFRHLERIKAIYIMTHNLWGYIYYDS